MNKIIKNNLISIACLALFMLLAIGSTDDGPKTPGKIEAYVYHKYFIKNRLKSPSTAEFFSYDASRVSKINNSTFKIRGYVDAQNGFGAMIRTNYSIVVKNETGEVRDWVLVSLDGI